MGSQTVSTNIQASASSFQQIIDAIPCTVYVVFPTSTLSYTIQKLLASPCLLLSTHTLTHPVPAAHSHRLFVTDNDFAVSSSPSFSHVGSGDLCGIISIVDSESCHPMCHLSLHHRPVLSLFARIANIPDVDPTQRMRHRRASSSSSKSSHDLSARSRSSSRTSVRLSASPRIIATTADKRNSISSLDAFQWSELVSPRKEEHR